MIPCLKEVSLNAFLKRFVKINLSHTAVWCKLNKESRRIGHTDHHNLVTDLRVFCKTDRNHSPKSNSIVELIMWSISCPGIDRRIEWGRAIASGVERFPHDRPLESPVLHANATLNCPETTISATSPDSHLLPHFLHAIITRRFIFITCRLHGNVDS